MNTQLEQFYRDRTVLVTGHTGFKGGWITTWLKMLGARVIGFSLPSDTGKPNLFEAIQVEKDMISIFGDIRDSASLTQTVQLYKPEIVLHMAAQPLVRRSYAQPLETYATNVMGTAHVLEAVRETPSVRAVIVITSDKCYENREWLYAYRENDPLGGHDPYSASKAAAELVVASYRSSFFRPAHRVSVASARAGNVIGGGDWSEDRLIPDCMKALSSGKPVLVRNPLSIRPWQHVMEPIVGYLWLALRMWREPGAYAEAWNFGPSANGNTTVGHIVNQVIREWRHGEWTDVSTLDPDSPHEARGLQLDCTKAITQLGWRPILSVREAVQSTVAWYQRYYSDCRFEMRDFTLQQIDSYTKRACANEVPWAISSIG